MFDSRQKHASGCEYTRFRVDKLAPRHSPTFTASFTQFYKSKIASNGKLLLRKPRLYQSCSAEEEEEEEIEEEEEEEEGEEEEEEEEEEEGEE